MKENLKTVLLAFSLFANILFVGTAAYSRFSVPAAPMTQAQRCALLFDRLGLSPEQRSRVEPLMAGFQARFRDIADSLRREQIALVSLLAAAHPDREAVAARQEAVRRLQAAMQDALVQHFIEQGAVFTDEQRRKFASLMRQRIEAGASVWMR